ncbi:uncharacterized protein ACA1_385590 [Acanthamoeba castellanii str. Neff]|uniref:Uncharacterized protein n=1 Tax=Acanthamoeba castellanii (strain ATCC 30010 / Neff) TaxID=1257118 RepID=L8H971_ACACF|nr:uncharacterized protein ACA1_385590 [Acanthamoeba castellanii str. Neff]ELR21782.1 hypothetical protein ACA1_385590 [Acanthamoeba castellanii str. Neff]
MNPAGPPTLPPEYDVWLYEAIEGEDVPGLDRPAAKPRHYATAFDDRVLVFLMFRKAISTMRQGRQEAYPQGASVNFVPIVDR